jgi:hypothetical protein
MLPETIILHHDPAEIFPKYAAGVAPVSHRNAAMNELVES